MTAQSQADNGASIGDLIQGGFSTGDDNRALKYIIEIPSITGVTGGINKIFSLRSNNPVLFTPDSDNFIFSPKIDVLRDRSSTKNLGSTITGGFDYTFTYK
ncbi:hypothetical protein FOK89_22640 [Salmonella enterica]|nr:hypothetical protein [Salmonella enterica]ECH2654757.1 hypothetical protein [Salmonella enterica]HBC0148548.1 hypothetical protein [Salmonella enterica subsp. houtenae]